MDEPDGGVDGPVPSDALLDVAGRVVRDQQEDRRYADGIEVVTTLLTALAAG